MAEVNIFVKAKDMASRELGKVKAGLENVKKEADEAKESGKNMGIDWSMTLLGINQALEIGRKAAEAFKQAIEFTKEGAAIERLMETSANLAEAMGGDMDSIVFAVNQATLGTVSDIDIMQASTRAMMLGISADADDMAQLWEVAAFRARAMGQDTEEAFVRITNAIASGHTQTLRNQGIMLDAADAYETYAESVGKSADQLTEAEKMQARLNAVIEDTIPLIEKAGGLQADTMAVWEQMDKAQEDYFNNLKRSFADSATWFAEFMTATFTRENLKAQIDDMVESLMAVGYTYEEVSDMIESKGFYFFDDQQAIEDMLIAVEILQAELNEVGEAAEFARRMTDPYSESLDYAAEATGRLAVGTEEVTEVIDEHERALARAAVRAIEYGGASDIARKALEDLGIEAEEQKRLMDELAESTEKKTAVDLLLEDVNLRLTGLWVDNAIGAERYNAALELANEVANEYPEALSTLLELFGEWGDKVQNISNLLHGLPSQIKIDVIQTWYEAQGGTWTGSQTQYVGKDIAINAAGGEVHAAAGLPVHWVGEMGPEPFIPAISGRIVSNTQAVQALREGRGGGGSPIYVTINTPYNFADRQWAERELIPLFRDVMRREMIA